MSRHSFYMLTELTQTRCFRKKFTISYNNNKMYKCIQCLIKHFETVTHSNKKLPHDLKCEPGFIYFVCVIIIWFDNKSFFPTLIWHPHYIHCHEWSKKSSTFFKLCTLLARINLFERLLDLESDGNGIMN